MYISRPRPQMRIDTFLMHSQPVKHHLKQLQPQRGDHTGEETVPLDLGSLELYLGPNTLGDPTTLKRG